jgi:hypothetical protein
VSHLGFGRGFHRLNEIAAYGLGQGVSANRRLGDHQHVGIASPAIGLFALAATAEQA